MNSCSTCDKPINYTANDGRRRLCYRCQRRAKHQESTQEQRMHNICTALQLWQQPTDEQAKEESEKQV